MVELFKHGKEVADEANMFVCTLLKIPRGIERAMECIVHKGLHVKIRHPGDGMLPKKSSKNYKRTI